LLLHTELLQWPVASHCHSPGRGLLLPFGGQDQRETWWPHGMCVKGSEWMKRESFAHLGRT
jgi:hypothetical protein